MRVTCGPLYEGQPAPKGGWCGRTYDDLNRWTICPHPHFDDPGGDAAMDAHTARPDGYGVADLPEQDA